jgi:YfiH family protein
MTDSMKKHVIGPIEFFTYDRFSRRDGVSCVTTTRAGGLSTGPFESFNLGLRCKDDEDTVIDNRAQLSLVTGAFPDLLTFGRQVHGSGVTVVTGELLGSGALDAESAIADTDGMVTDIPDIPLVVLVADCAALSLYDPVKGVIGVAHAGWRGTVAGIAVVMVETMKEAFGTRPSDLIAGIGPSIGPCCYEVGGDVVDGVHDRHPDIAGRVIIADERTAAPSARLDLWTANFLQLTAAGVREDRIEVAGLCTSCHRDVFYSHRAEDGRTGRFASLIMLHAKTHRSY